MTDLLSLQRRMADLVMQPLTRQERTRQRTVDGRLISSEAESLIKPNSRLSSFERLEIYNQQYWFRVLSCFGEDFPGVRAVVGAREFERIARAYLEETPSVSFTLRNLGSKLVTWLSDRGYSGIVLDMAKIEWAHIEAFDGLALEPLAPSHIADQGFDLRVQLQPYVRLLELAYPVDDLLIEVRQYQGGDGTAVNAARMGQFRRRIRTRVLPMPETVYLAVHRMDDSVYYKRLAREAFLILQSLAAGNTLETALDVAFADTLMPENDRLEALQHWFALWAEMGWFARA